MPVPFIIAAHGERGLWTSARYADGWTSLGGQPYSIAQDPARRLKLEDAVAGTRRLGGRLDQMCHAIGRNPGSIFQSVLAYRPSFDPLSSLDAFDEYVDRYAEIGIREIIFYWPPLDNLFPVSTSRPGASFTFGAAIAISPDQRRALERIARDRIEQTTRHPVSRRD